MNGAGFLGSDVASVQVGGDSILKALSAAEYNSPDAEASAPVLQAFAVVIR